MNALISQNILKQEMFISIFKRQMRISDFKEWGEQMIYRPLSRFL